MHQYTFRQIFTAAGALVLISAIIFWSFNELSELFGGPQAQFKHAIAAIAFLLVIKWSLTRSRGGHERSSIEHQHLRNSGDSACDH